MKKKPDLSFWQIWNMSFGFLGIQFGFALQNANVSRIFETLGAKVDEIPILWIAAPVTGLIMQPIIGHMSDNTWNRLGRRRPYFLTGAILASLALIIMPNSPILWIAAGMLWIMDASINISMEPFRAFVGDMLPSKQRTKGFAMQSFFIGTGAVVASALPYILTNWFGIANTAPKGEIPPSVKFSFYLGAVAFFSAVLWTVIRTKEYPPDELRQHAEAEGNTVFKAHADEIENPASTGKIFLKTSAVWISAGILISLGIFYFKLHPELYIFSVGIASYGIMMLVSGSLIRSGHTKNGIAIVMHDMYKMPGTMRQLAVVQFFSWFALFAMWIYTTAAVTSSKYDMKLDQSTYRQLVETVSQSEGSNNETVFKELPGIREELDRFGKRFEKGKEVAVTMKVVQFFTDSARVGILHVNPDIVTRFQKVNFEYNKGADWVGVLMAVYNGFAAIMAFFIIWLAGRIGRKRTHAINLIIGGIALISFFFIKNPKILMISELGIGLAWASILSMPYAILTGALPAHKMGTYMGIFNFFIVIPQILAASILGFFTRDLFGGEAIYSLMLGGFSLFIAAITVLFVNDVDAKTMNK
jgi:maltose/moltooligosaccharide transporter